jgi:type II secretory pathway component PulM
MMARLPAAWTDAWDRASPRERTLLGFTTAIVVLAVAYAVAWQPLARDIARTHDELDRDRDVLAVLRTYVEAPTATTTPAPPGDARGAVIRALDARNLRASASAIEAREGRVSVVLGAAPFDAVVLLLDDLARTDGLRVIEARVTARVEPGTVRAELTLGR